MQKQPTSPINMPSEAHQPLSLPQAMQLAAKHQAEGRLPQAEVLLKRVLQTAPQNAHALHLLGVINHQQGHTDTAINMIAQAISINPNIAQFYSNIGEMCRQLKRIDEAIRYGQQAIKLSPDFATAHSNLGIAYYDNEQLDDAFAAQEMALSINPKLVSAINNLGSIARDNKERDIAIDFYRQVISIAPNHLESINNLGATLTENEQPDEAIKTLLSAIKINPNYAEAHCNIGTAFLALEHTDKAEIGFKKALQLRPDYCEAHIGLARTLQEKKNLPAARALAEKALLLSPSNVSAHNLLGGIYTESGFPDKAKLAYSSALKIDSDSIPAFLGLGHLNMEQGDMCQAEESFQHALNLDKDNLGAHIALMQVKKATPDDAHFMHLISQAESIDSALDAKAISLHFALGKGYDDTKQYDLAFNHYKEGCRLKSKTMPYSQVANKASVDNIRQFFSKENIDALRGTGCTSDAPIFVLGMPRSGTTLTEQIIASHPDVHGAGELPDLLQLANKPNDWETAGYPNVLTGFSHSQLTALGEKYVTGLKERDPSAKHITDKMPANFNCVGLIHLILPNAKIIHVKRNPVDTCLSGFSRSFNKTQPQSYDLSNIGSYYRNYHDLMEHWKNVLPTGSFYEIQYEDLVADTEAQSKALIDYCGLAWDDACLEFHKNKRNIRTASITQVRQPIYKTSIERWRSYESHLGPLFDALGNLAPKK